MTLLTGVVAIAVVLTFLGIMVWYIKEVPFTIIVVLVLALLLYDFVQSLRSERGGPQS
jgi:hypothetical protein